ncbi:hypothetical protein [Bradyrhizobium australiense]|uniref:Uncharacterized protein n=1 Tax=Bradyrhizobium australiense TaxID=2721161 RepID=A0A7Y4LYI0_9BRAD|nr:hypothetical protein [Bradyrhizobium australiense]NOJ43304.1 hypothetical protein [Bradyrhizobium australiense]
MSSNLPMIRPSSRLDLAVPQGLQAATAPFHIATPLAAALDQVDGEEFRDLVRVNGAGDLWVLWDADGDPRDLWRYADRAASYLERLPALPDVEAAHRVVRADLDAEPPIEVRAELIFTMLDAQNTTATQTYLQLLASKLGNSPRRQTEKYERTRPWFSTAAIAATIDEVVETMTPKHGRPIDIADILDIAGRHASELIRLDTALETIGKAIPVLSQIVDAVTDVPRPATLRPRGWQPPPMGPDEEPPPF